MQRVRLACLALLGVFAVSADRAARAADKPVVILDTTVGKITIELDSAKAPMTVENFLKYVDLGHYNDTVFHRVIDGFMIQGGGMSSKNQEKPTNPPIKNEADNGLKNVRGTIAMARKRNPDSATAQFFINLKENRSLDRGNPDSVDDYGYTVFGKVTDGMDVVDKIAKGATRPGPNGEDSEPVKPIVVKSAKRKTKQ
jgi:peptidyl-prolyl cis-trans isomerase A (cyclophilin A)